MESTFVGQSYLRMVEKVSDYAIFLVDPEGVVLTWNPGAEVMKGYRKDEIVGRNLDVLYTAEQRRDGIPAHNLRMAREHGTFQEEALRQRKDGSQFWAQVEIIAITDDSGSLMGFCKLTRDVTQRREMEDALREADRRKDEFLAMLAHELRNPLAPVSAAANLLASGKLDTSATKKASHVIIRQVAHMAELVEDLLDVSRVSRGLITMNMAPLDMKPVVSHAIEQVRPLIESLGHTVSIKLAPARTHVNGDEKRLIQVISNLLHNSAKYTPPGGEIQVALSASESDVCVEVSDSGVGIAPELQKVIFELFEQVQRTPDRTSGGLGIGLALVRSLTKLHSGTVACHSDGIGHGSRFTICLPLLPPESPAPEARIGNASDDLATAPTKLSVLVVDDNVDAAEMLQFFLSAVGHHVRVAHTAKAALEAIQAAPPDVCLLDIGLPDSTGFDLAINIRNLLAPPPTLIALTGYGTVQDHTHAEEAGFDHYFVKPADLALLSKVLSGVETLPRL